MSNLIKSIQNNWIPPQNTYELAKNEFRVSTSVYCDLRVFLDKMFEQPELQTTEDAHIIKEKERDLHQEGIFATGHAYHAYVQSILEKDYLIEKEKLVTINYKTIRVVGHLDMLLQEEEGNLKVCDIKACKPTAYAYKTREASWHHRQQANLYAYILSIYTYSVLYINKVTFEMVEHEYPTDLNAALALLNKLVNIHATVLETVKNFDDGGKLEGDEIKRTNEDWECDYCPYEEVCPQ